MENIAGYVLDHTTRDEGRWHRLAGDERGPYLVSALFNPRKDEFLRLVRLHGETSSGCNPLDGREHSLDEIARWIMNRALAVRFVGLGVVLGIFELTSPEQPLAGEDPEEMYRRPGWLNEARFRLKVARSREAIAGSRPENGPPRARRRPGPRRARYTRGKRARAYCTAALNGCGW